MRKIKKANAERLEFGEFLKSVGSSRRYTALEDSPETLKAMINLLLT